MLNITLNPETRKRLTQSGHLVGWRKLYSHHGAVKIPLFQCVCHYITNDDDKSLAYLIGKRIRSWRPEIKRPFTPLMFVISTLDITHKIVAPVSIDGCIVMFVRSITRKEVCFCVKEKAGSKVYDRSVPVCEIDKIL